LQLEIKRESQQHQRKIVFIPDDISLSRPIESCIFSSLNYPPESIVGLGGIVGHCIGETVSRFQKKKTDGAYRKPPLAISRLGRGGRTTTLKMIFDALKASNMNVNPLHINFNSNFI
jgi:hypothetical protein